MMFVVTLGDVVELVFTVLMIFVSIVLIAQLKGRHKEK